MKMKRCIITILCGLVFAISATAQYREFRYTINKGRPSGLPYVSQMNHYGVYFKEDVYNVARDNGWKILYLQTGLVRRYGVKGKNMVTYVEFMPAEEMDAFLTEPLPSKSEYSQYLKNHPAYGPWDERIKKSIAGGQGKNGICYMEIPNPEQANFREDQLAFLARMNNCLVTGYETSRDYLSGMHFFCLDDLQHKLVSLIGESGVRFKNKGKAEMIVVNYHVEMQQFRSFNNVYWTGEVDQQGRCTGTGTALMVDRDKDDVILFKGTLDKGRITGDFYAEHQSFSSLIRGRCNRDYYSKGTLYPEKNGMIRMDYTEQGTKGPTAFLLPNHQYAITNAGNVSVTKKVRTSAPASATDFGPEYAVVTQAIKSDYLKEVSFLIDKKGLFLRYSDDTIKKVNKIADGIANKWYGPLVDVINPQDIDDPAAALSRRGLSLTTAITEIPHFSSFLADVGIDVNSSGELWISRELALVYCALQTDLDAEEKSMFAAANTDPYEWREGGKVCFEAAGKKLSRWIRLANQLTKASYVYFDLDDFSIDGPAIPLNTESEQEAWKTLGQKLSRRSLLFEQSLKRATAVYDERLDAYIAAWKRKNNETQINQESDDDDYSYPDSSQGDYYDWALWEEYIFWN